MPSPCIGICKLDTATGYCIGCARTSDEIANWRSAPVEEQRRIWAALPDRRKLLSVEAHRLPWTADDIAHFIEATLRERAGTWVIGVYGAVGEFVIGPDENVDIVSDATVVTASTERAALRLRKHPKTVAFALGRRDDSGAPRAIGLTLPRGVARVGSQATVASLGPDTHSVSPRFREEILFDFGLGRSVARFCVRTGLPDFRARLDAVSGLPWKDAMAQLGHELLRVSPHRVIETALGRVEVFAPIPKPGENSPDGPHTHLLPGLLALNRETPPDWDLPQIFAPCAMFYPDHSTSIDQLVPASN
jgi:predicted Fe-S protein YdhL (DUF1289 family)